MYVGSLLRFQFTVTGLKWINHVSLNRTWFSNVSSVVDHYSVLLPGLDR